MIDIAKTILPFALIFGAIALLSAIALVRSCSTGIGRRVAPSADPYRHPFGEIAPLPSGSLVERLNYPRDDISRPQVRSIPHAR